MFEDVSLGGQELRKRERGFTGGGTQRSRMPHTVFGGSVCWIVGAAVDQRTSFRVIRNPLGEGGHARVHTIVTGPSTPIAPADDAGQSALRA